ncbi:hypothetical protein D3C75_758220 [compost metagenome]
MRVLSVGKKAGIILEITWLSTAWTHLAGTRVAVVSHVIGVIQVLNGWKLMVGMKKKNRKFQ